MKRLAGLTLAWMLATFTLAPGVAGAQGVISASPPSGPAGLEVTIIISGFGEDVPVEVRAGSSSGTLLGTGMTNGSGIAGIPITIPADAPTGPYTIYACGSCSSEFKAGEATTTFDVVAPPVTTQTTEAPPTSDDPETPPPPPAEGDAPLPDPVPAESCGVPDGAVVIDFELWDEGATEPRDWSGWLWGLYAAHYPYVEVFTNEWIDPYGELESETFPDYRLDPAEVDYGGDWYIGAVGGDLTTSSPSQFLGSEGTAKYMLSVGDSVGYQGRPGSRALTSGRLDYVGFNVGFGVDGRSLPPGDELVVELRVWLLPIHDLDNDRVIENDWGSTRVYLGTGPQPVTTCIQLENPIGLENQFAWYLIEVVPMTADGAVLDDVAFQIDDMFFGVEDAPLPFLADAPSSSGDSEWPIRIMFAVAGAILMLAASAVFRRR